MSSKAKKAASTTNDYVDYQPKDLIWAKMKGFTPWPSMVVEPPLDMINANRRPETKCVFFFGSRNFAWIEISKLKPFDGPWRAEMSRGGTKPSASFRTAIKDIEAYMENPLEVDAEINELIANKNASAPDFDRIRDGLENEEEDVAAAGIDNGEVQANEAPINKTPKRTPKPKASGAASTKARSTVGSKTPTKRRRSSQANSSTKRKRSSLPTRDDISDSPNDRRRILNAETLATLGFATRRNPNSNALLHRPIVSRPDPQTVNMSHRSTVLAERAITPSELTFGFMGLGIMGAAIVKDLICTGHNVVVWNRTASKCEPFVEAGAKFAATPMDVVELCDIIFCCVSDPRACKDLVFGNCGVLNIKDLNQKAYVEMTTIDPESSLDIAEGIKQNNGRYLEVQINGTRQEAEDGMLIVLAGGDRTVFEDCHSCFKTIAKNTFFLGDIGNACKVNLILQTIVGTSLVGLAEALALADRFSISLKDIIDIFELTSMKSPLLIAKGKEMAKGEFNPDHPLSHMQKDLRLVLGMAENLDQAMPLTATANEVFKHTKRLGYGEHDSSAVFVRFNEKVTTSQKNKSSRNPPALQILLPHDKNRRRVENHPNIVTFEYDKRLLKYFEHCCRLIVNIRTCFWSQSSNVQDRRSSADGLILPMQIAKNLMSLNVQYPPTVESPTSPRDPCSSNVPSALAMKEQLHNSPTTKEYNKPVESSLRSSDFSTVSTEEDTQPALNSLQSMTYSTAISPFKIRNDRPMLDVVTVKCFPLVPYNTEKPSNKCAVCKYSTERKFSKNFPEAQANQTSSNEKEPIQPIVRKINLNLDSIVPIPCARIQESAEYFRPNGGIPTTSNNL